MSRDGPKLDQKALEAIRIHALFRVRQDGASPEALIDALGFHRSFIYHLFITGSSGMMRAAWRRSKPNRFRARRLN